MAAKLKRHYRQQGDMLLILLCGGDKSTQAKDIEKAPRDREGVGELWQRLSSSPTTRRIT